MGSGLAREWMQRDLPVRQRRSVTLKSPRVLRTRSRASLAPTGSTSNLGGIGLARDSYFSITHPH